MPIGGGFAVLVMLGALYAGKKLLDFKPELQEEK